jgi:hypothetical protein
MESSVEFQVAWPGAPPNTGQPLLDDSLGQFMIAFGDDIATRYRTHNGSEGDRLFIPTYHAAEWAALNWWPLLFEPPKNEDYQNNFDYRSRHWLGSARNGFALPDLWFCPASGKIEIIGDAADLAFSRLSFLVAISEVVETQQFSNAVSSFIDMVVQRLDDRGRKDTELHQIWHLVKTTPPEGEEYCRLMGALGLSPYQENPQIEEVLDIISSRLPSRVVLDLCETSDKATLSPLADMTIAAVETLGGMREIDLSDLLSVSLPSDSARFAWQRGREAAGRVRKHFHISNADPEGSKKFFDRLDLETNGVATDKGANQLQGALQRVDANMQLAVLDDREPQQRFIAARAAFLGWATETDAARLVTSAITRDQQASRAFAAEIIAPVAYIRTKAKNKILSDHGIQEIAEILHAPVGAVAYQARHGGIHIPQRSLW